jgi:type II protein arginine methyltransferase
MSHHHATNSNTASSSTTTAAATSTDRLLPPSLPSPPPRMILGLHHPDKAMLHNAFAALQSARPDGYDFVTCSIPPSPLTHTASSTDETMVAAASDSLLRVDMTLLESKWWRTSVVGLCHDDSNSWESDLAWSVHMNLPAVILPPLPHESLPAAAATAAATALSHYASALTGAMAATLHHSNMQLWIPVPLVAASSSHTSATDMDTFSVFHVFHRLLDYHPAIHILLVFDEASALSSPTTPSPDLVKQQLMNAWRHAHLWIGTCPIAAIQLPCRSFLTNKRGFPALPKAHQMILSALFRRVGRTLKVLVSTSTSLSMSRTLSPHSSSLLGASLTPEQLGATGTLPYQQYLNHFRASRVEITSALDSDVAALESDYLDALQQPLQPLSDHLEFQTYENFEQDPVKYAQYQSAMYHAMVDFVNRKRQMDCAVESIVALPPATRTVSPRHSSDMDTTCSEAEDKDHALSSPSKVTTATNSAIPYIVLVVGAGRGPLVTSCLRAYQQLQADPSVRDMIRRVQLSVFAVEKNPSAVLYLRSKLHHADSEWAGAPIQIVHSDLRTLRAAQLFATSTAQQANLVVSELLGSFGCNELSPECLDALFETDVCHHTDTISIPTRYTSHAAPVSSLKLHHAVKTQALYPIHSDCSVAQVLGSTKAVETPYVVRTHAASQTHAAVDCWSFEHAPLQQDLAMLAGRGRHAHLTFSNDADRMYATASGSGYGALDDIATSIVSSSSNAVDAIKDAALAPLPWVCTGVLGTMTADLYVPEPQSTTSSPLPKPRAIQISTAPQTFSVGMFSWFPLYFPLSQPVLVPAGATVVVDLWRKCNETKVWYEWAIQVVRQSREGSNSTAEVLYTSAIHNPSGRSSFVSLQ